MSDERLKLSQELDEFIVLFYREPTDTNKQNMESKRLELHESLSNIS